MIIWKVPKEVLVALGQRGECEVRGTKTTGRTSVMEGGLFFTN